MCKELGRLSQGYGKTAGTNTIFFIKRSQVPKGEKVTYFSIVCTHRPQKADPNRVRLVAGGDKLLYDGPIRTPTADLITCKIHLNRVISTKGAKYMTGDIGNFYLGTPMKNYVYAKMHRISIQQKFINEYDLEDSFDADG